MTTQAEKAIQILEQAKTGDVAALVPDLDGIDQEASSDDLTVLKFEDGSIARFSFTAGGWRAESAPSPSIFIFDVDVDVDS